MMKLIIAQIGACGVLLYFAYHAMSGKQGLAEWTRLQKQERELAAEISDLDAEKIQIKSQIKRLQADRLDLDFVEELSREKLAFARQDELIVYRESIE